MSTPKVSIVVPIYGVEKYLNQCVDSILAQTLKDIEIILVDDGSKDKCPEIVDEYAKKDSRVVAIHQENGGYGKAVNVGLSMCKGEYISIIEPDDFIDKDMFIDLYNIAKKNCSDIVKSNFTSFLDNTKNGKDTLIKVTYTPPLQSEEMSFRICECPSLFASHPSIWSSIYKKSFLDSFNIKMIEAPGSGWTDNPFQVQSMCLANRINFTDKSYYHWRISNKDPSEELKDYKVPFLRSFEIHDWLELNGIKDNELLFHLSKREIGYICIVLHKKNISNLLDCYERVKALCEKISPTVLSNLDKYSRWEKEVFFGCFANIENVRKSILKKGISGPFLYRLSLAIIRKYLFRLHIRKNGFLLLLLGIAITNEETDLWPKPLLKIKI